MVEVTGQNKRFETNCPNCGAGLRFKKSDVRVGEELKGYSEFDRYHKSLITCPQCKQPVDVTGSYGTSSEEAYYEQQRNEDYI